MKKILPILLMIVIFSGCTAAGLQVNERAFVQLFGMEKSGDVYRVYLQLLENETVDGEGITILGAVADAELKQGKKLFLGQMKLFVIGEGLTNLSEELNVFLSGDICPACPILYSEKPEEIITSEIPAEEILAELNVYSSQGKSILTPLTEIAAKSAGTYTSAAVPKVNFSDKAISFDGLVLISKHGKFGELSNDDALGVKLLCGGLSNSDRITVSLNIDGEKVSGEILKIKAKPKLHLLDGNLVLSENIKISADITEKPLDMDEGAAIEAITVYVERAVYEAYSITVWELDTDVFGLGKLIRKHAGAIYDSYTENPKAFRQNSIIDIEVETI
ncbi:MAG: Ger(x)C family spore germination C-terminal domain-containing protein [Ruminococcus sp.]|jgi:hypothetical protein|nr:Ger(x)C family spore germination C-terminal domain-containing protein [Ruminococcus sp.]